MAKNTGRGSRIAQQSPQVTMTNMWTRRDTSAGRFIDAKTQGGTFRGVRRTRRYPLRRALARINFFPFGIFGLFIAALITFNIVTFATGAAHYEIHSLFAYTYTLDLGNFHYRYANGASFYGN